MDLNRVLEVVKEVAVQAGEAIMEVYNHFDDSKVEYKKDDSPLTAADKASNAIIVECLRNSRYTYFICSDCLIISKVLPTPSVIWHRILVP